MNKENTDNTVNKIEKTMQVAWINTAWSSLPWGYILTS